MSCDHWKPSRGCKCHGRQLPKRLTQVNQNTIFPEEYVRSKQTISSSNVSGSFRFSKRVLYVLWCHRFISHCQDWDLYSQRSPSHHRFLRLSFCILILIVGSLHIDTWLVATQRFFLFSPLFGEDFHFHLYFFKWVENHQLDTVLIYLFTFVFARGGGWSCWVFWAWYRNRTCQLGETWYLIINLTYANFREKLTTSWRLQECDNEHIMEVYCKDIKQDNPVSSSIHHWTYRSWMSFAYTCLYTFVLVQQHVEPTESEDIPVGLLCLLVGFCGIASGVMQSNLSWRWKWLHKINCGGIQHLKGCHVGWESIFLLANKMISWGLDSICETWF